MKQLCCFIFMLTVVMAQKAIYTSELFPYPNDYGFVLFENLKVISINSTVIAFAEGYLLYLIDSKKDLVYNYLYYQNHLIDFLHWYIIHFLNYLLKDKVYHVLFYLYLKHMKLDLQQVYSLHMKLHLKVYFLSNLTKLLFKKRF